MNLLENVALAVRSVGGIASVAGDVLSAKNVESTATVVIAKGKKSYDVEIKRATGSPVKKRVPITLGAEQLIRQLVIDELGLPDPTDDARPSLRHMEETQDG